MNCDRIAHWYRWLEYLAFGRGLQRRRNAFVADISNVRRALVLGDGDGRFLKSFVERSPDVSIDCVDLSGRMLELARHRAGERVNYIHGDALTIPLPAATYDLIVTHFFIDCFDHRDAPALVDRISAAACRDARWLISEFRESRWWARPVIAGLYLFFRIAAGLKTTRLIDHHPLLGSRGFVLMKSESARGGLLVSELWRRA